MATAVLNPHHRNVNHTFMKKPLSADRLHYQHAVLDPKQLIGNALRKRVESIDHKSCEPGDEDSFFVADLGDVYRQHIRWKKNLPRVKPFYGKQAS